MIIRKTQRGHYAIRFFARICIAIVFLAIIAGCGSASQNTSVATVVPTKPTIAPAKPTGQPSPSPTVQSILQGKSNFVLDTPFNFSNVNGTTTDNSGVPTPIAQNTVESGITSELQHRLFVVTNGSDIQIYSQGSTTPIKAQVTQGTDGSVDVSYTQVSNTAQGSTNISFDGIMLNDQIFVHYQQSYTPTITSSEMQSIVTVAFSAKVQWVTPSQIPTSPANGRFQFTSASAVALAWDAGKNAVAYDVYRQIPSQDQSFKFVATVKNTTYTDTSADAWQNAHTSTGITYGIFAVGPTRVENPSGLPIPVATP
ncbi:MAG TPA: hypothetical protein VFB12_06295 [Ktedonobacteraceae bacterium]|nr:hypothetical protein [Ktedonobacteraceae bacterium]